MYGVESHLLDQDIHSVGRIHIREQLLGRPNPLHRKEEALVEEREVPYEANVEEADVEGLGTFACSACHYTAKRQLGKDNQAHALLKGEQLYHEHICEASTTLLCLNGLKSSLMLTGVFLITRVPKNGLFGTAEVCEFSCQKFR